jgi:hypothetical protein
MWHRFFIIGFLASHLVLGTIVIWLGVASVNPFSSFSMGAVSVAVLLLGEMLILGALFAAACHSTAKRTSHPDKQR